MRKLVKGFFVLIIVLVLGLTITSSVSAEYCEDHDLDPQTPEVCWP